MSDLFNFRDWLDNLNELTDDQRAELLNRLSAMENEKNRKAEEQGLLTNEHGAMACPHCGSVAVKKHGTKDNKQRYYCKDCHKTFMETTTSIFNYSHLEIWQWKEILKGMVTNLSIRQMADLTGLSPKTVWYNKNKVMQLVSSQFGEQDHFDDIAECDETEVHLSYKGKRDPKFFIYHLKRMPWARRTRAEKIAYLEKYGLLEELRQDPDFLESLLGSDCYLAGTKKDSVCILTGVDRSGDLYMKPTCVGKLETTHVTTSFDGRFTPDAIMVTDGSPAYNWFAEERNIYHQQIPADKHAIGPYSLSRVNAVHSEFNTYYPKHKENLPATKYLDIGVDFFWWLQKNKDKSIQEKVNTLFDMMMANEFNLTYEEMRHRKLSLDTKGLIPTAL